ncbi:hypothetical protein [Janthinobacterium sp. P210006]|uniref:hypothetical protein n=1 Tax=Janthinobacterium sp. P210006 TaxID=3112939 RepID=UPI002E257566|nr:hypothetical protein [Janthinobacterium sp. P210006]
MTVNLNPLDGHAPSPGNPFAQPQGQQERWLFELETALLEQGVKKNTQRAAVDAGERGHPPEPQPKQAGAPLPLSAAAGALNGNLQPAPAVPGALPGAYALYGAADGVLPLAAGPGAVAGDAPGRVMMSTASGENDSANVIPARPLTLPSSLSAGAAASLGSGPMPETESANLPATQLTQEDRQDYALRQLHLLRESDGVRAWIRDASLSAVQERLVAQTMLLELHGAGTRITALTVNGKEIPLKQKACVATDCFIAEPMFPGSAGIPLKTKDAL